MYHLYLIQLVSSPTRAPSTPPLPARSPRQMISIVNIIGIIIVIIIVVIVIIIIISSSSSFIIVIVIMFIVLLL